MRIKGKVKWYNVKNGYGFIAGDDGGDYFVHFTSIPTGTRLYENDEVEFDGVETEKGKQAQNVEKTGSAPQDAAPAEGEAPAEEQQEAPAEQPVEESEDF